jgi:hypothetical protein
MPLVTRLLASTVRLKRAGVGTNGILECKILSENTHRTSDGSAVIELYLKDMVSNSVTESNALAAGIAVILLRAKFLQSTTN